MTHAGRQSRSADPPPDRLEEPGLLRRSRVPSRRWSGSSTSATAAAAASACASRSRRCSTWSTPPPTARCTASPRGDYWKVVDQCYLCDLCYMTKCPYVPPHPWNARLPAPDAARQGDQVHERASVEARREASSPRPTCTASSPASRSSCRRSTRSTARKPMRKLMDKALRRAPRRLDARAGDAALPLERARRAARATVVANGERTPGKVAIFSTCYVNYNEPGIGHDLLKLLEHNEIPYVIVEKEQLLRHAQARARRPRSRSRSTRTPTSRCWRATRARATRSSARSRAAR